jgi:hypothetical protein
MEENKNLLIDTQRYRYKDFYRIIKRSRFFYTLEDFDNLMIRVNKFIMENNYRVINFETIYKKDKDKFIRVWYENIMS